jgi:hypothetical protein
MHNRRTDVEPTSRRGGRVKAEAAEGGGTPVPALTRPNRSRNAKINGSRLTRKTIALPQARARDLVAMVNP